MRPYKYFGQDIKLSCQFDASGITESVWWREQLEAFGITEQATRGFWYHWTSRSTRPNIANQTNIGTVSRATLGNTPERRGGAHMGLPERIDTILNWTELNWTEPAWWTEQLEAFSRDFFFRIRVFRLYFFVQIMSRPGELEKGQHKYPLANPGMAEQGVD